MLKKAVLVSGLLLPFTMQAQTFTDVYGDSSLKPNKTMQRYIKQLGETQHSMLALIEAGPEQANSKKAQAIMKRKFLLEDRIKKAGDYAYVTSKGIVYPDRNFYTTIDVVRKDDLKRLSFLPSLEAATHSAAQIQMNHTANDVIDQRTKFSELEMSLLTSNKLDKKPYYCPVYHCGAGFSDHRLKPYLPIFNQAAIADKQLIIKTLRNDPDPTRRASAVLLVGHFKNPQEIFNVLSPMIEDRNEEVRNDALRVIGTTLEKSKLANFDLKPFLRLLDSPVVNDRNKALMVVSAVADNPKYKHVILNEGGENLIELLNLYQPNNHDLAYLTLKKASNQNLTDRDIQGWSTWLKNYQNKSMS